MSASSKPHPGGSNSIVVSWAVFLTSEDIVGAFFIKSEGIVGPCLLAANPTQAVLTISFLLLLCTFKSEDIVGSCLLAANPTLAVLNNINFRWAVYC